MLSRILEILELPIIDDSVHRYKALKYKELEDKFAALGINYFIFKWFADKKKLPEISKAYSEVSLNNVFNLALLCSYVERYGIPERTWLKEIALTIANGDEFIIPQGNVKFYMMLASRASKHLHDKPLDRNRLMNAAEQCGIPHFRKKAELYNKVFEQGLIKRGKAECFYWSSPEIHNVFKNTSPWHITPTELIESQYTSRMNILIPKWRKLI
jgi:hypothetical protein